MTKLTSRCIDTGQEHPLLDKFEEWFSFKADFNFKGTGSYLLGYDYGQGGGYRIYTYNSHLPKIITLDQRRERRGKEYYGETRK